LATLSSDQKCCSIPAWVPMVTRLTSTEMNVVLMHWRYNPNIGNAVRCLRTADISKGSRRDGRGCVPRRCRKGCLPRDGCLSLLSRPLLLESQEIRCVSRHSCWRFQFRTQHGLRSRAQGEEACSCRLALSTLQYRWPRVKEIQRASGSQPTGCAAKHCTARRPRASTGDCDRLAWAHHPPAQTREQLWTAVRCWSSGAGKRDSMPLDAQLHAGQQWQPVSRKSRLKMVRVGVGGGVPIPGCQALQLVSAMSVAVIPVLYRVRPSWTAGVASSGASGPGGRSSELCERQPVGGRRRGGWRGGGTGGGKREGSTPRHRPRPPR
jgi:hypothetical protein